MAYMTARKRAEGLGSAKSGTEHHWHTQVTSIALLILVPLFVFTFGPALGQRYADVQEIYARPFPAIVAALTLVVSAKHFASGAQSLWLDYTDGVTRKLAIIATTCVAYAAAAAGLFGLARLAL